MSRLLGAVALYASMILAWTAAGLFLLISPARAGNLIHDSFGLFPHVGRTDRGKKTLLRAIGIGLVAFAIYFLLRIKALWEQA